MKRIRRSLFWRNVLFTILQPGVVAGLIPNWLAGGWEGIEDEWSWQRCTGALILLAGIMITGHCIYRFMIDGQGTLSPADPTRRLVVLGLYRYSRNPMYVGVSLMLAGEALIISRQSMWIYTAAVIIAFNLFIIFFEEPRLRRDFGDEYDAYSHRVRRWM